MSTTSPIAAIAAACTLLIGATLGATPGLAEPAAAATAGPGQTSGYRGSGRPRGPMHHLGRQLDLSEEQKAQIQQIYAGASEEREALRAQMQAMRMQIAEMLRSGNYYEDQVRVLAESNTSVFVERTVLSARTMNQVREVLTPEQRAKMEELRANRRAGRFGPSGDPGF